MRHKIMELETTSGCLGPTYPAEKLGGNRTDYDFCVDVGHVFCERLYSTLAEKMNCKFTNLVLNIGEEADAGWAEVSEDSRGSGSGLPRLIRRWGLEAPPLLICHGVGGVGGVRGGFLTLPWAVSELGFSVSSSS